MIQLELFELSREEQLEIDLQKVKESTDKVRKKLFRENGELRKMYNDLKNEFEQLKIAMCGK